MTAAHRPELLAARRESRRLWRAGTVGFRRSSAAEKTTPHGWERSSRRRRAGLMARDGFFTSRIEVKRPPEGPVATPRRPVAPNRDVNPGCWSRRRLRQRPRLPRPPERRLRLRLVDGPGRRRRLRRLGADRRMGQGGLEAAMLIEKARGLLPSAPVSILGMSKQRSSNAGRPRIQAKRSARRFRPAISISRYRTSPKRRSRDGRNRRAAR